jgi:hypothetical protein
MKVGSAVFQRSRGLQPSEKAHEYRAFRLGFLPLFYDLKEERLAKLKENCKKRQGTTLVVP